MDTVLGLSLTRTGPAFPFFGTLLGWLGVALTGTDAGSNALFGNLQKVTAERLGISPILMASANSSGGVMGKMIDAQSIVVASTATRQVGNEAAIFRAVFKHSIALACLVGAIVMLYAFVFPWDHPRGDDGPVDPVGCRPLSTHRLPMISLPARVPRAHQVLRSTESLTNFTEPSPKATLTPPGWLLVAVIAAPIPPQVAFEM